MEAALKMERVILTALDWDLNRPTPFKVFGDSPHAFDVPSAAAAGGRGAGAHARQTSSTTHLENAKNRRQSPAGPLLSPGGVGGGLALVGFGVDRRLRLAARLRRPGK